MDVIGRVREFKGEKYIYPTIVLKVKDPNVIPLRIMEITRVRMKKALAFLTRRSEEGLGSL